VADSDDVLAVALERADALADPDRTRLGALLHPAFGWTSHGRRPALRHRASMPVVTA
jgi:hypothetical protein